MMHKLFFSLKRWTYGTVIFFTFLSSHTLWAQQTARSTTGGIGYLEHLPPNYASNPGKTYPLLIFLHGSGEVGNGSPSDLQKVKVVGPPQIIESGHNMCFTVNGVEECFIVISPQLPSSNGGWWPSVLQPLFDYVMNGPQNYRIDKTRVYLTGLSLGGWGTYIGLAETTDIFAAGAVVCGFSDANACTISARKIPVWGFHGESDGTIKYGDGLTEFNRIGWCTSPAPTAELKWSNYPGVGHNAWDNAYKTDHSVHSPNLYEWLLSKRKNAPSNNVPAANAGADKVITLPTSSLSLTGTGTDSDGTISTYSWTKLSGGVASLANGTSNTVNISGLASGSYVFRLTVTDNKGSSSSDDVTVTVNSAPNVSPVANAGPDKIVTLPLGILSLVGSATDADGSITSYAWTKVSGGTAILANIGTNTLGLTGLLSGSYVFRLTVTDNKGATATDDVTITVNGLLNTAPTANAGVDQTIVLPVNSLNLMGTGTDQGGSITSYAWSKISGGTATLNNASSATLNLSGLSVGTYVFRLTVTDNAGATATDEVTITVNPQPVNSGSNLALSKTAVTSSDEGWANSGKEAVDGSGLTRWSSKFSDPQWIYVDLGSSVSVSRVKLTWQYASASSFKIQVSHDATNWTDISSVTGNTAYTNDLTGLNGSGRYVRMYGITRTSQYGYSLYEFEVYGGVNAKPVVNAGADQTITLPTNATTLRGTASDSDGTISSYAWTKISGGSATLAAANTSTLNLSALASGSYVFRLTVTDNSGNTALDDVTVVVNPSANIGENQALFTRAVTSSNESSTFSGAQAIDGNLSTRWASNFSDAEWIYVDFGTTLKVDRVKIVWQYANASSFKIQVSNDATNWTDIRSITNNTSYTNDITGLNSMGRYVRMLGVKRNTGFGYSIYEFEVYGDQSDSRLSSIAQEEILPGSETIEEEGSGLVFFNKTYSGNDYSVRIYDANGRQVYNGKWEQDLYNEIFIDKGLYIYHVLKGGRQVDSGKLFIKG